MDSRQGVVLQLEDWARGRNFLIAKKLLVTKCYTGPRESGPLWKR